MIISPENRSRIVLVSFFLIDHVVWIYGGHIEQASFFYVALSECVRLLALIFVLGSFFSKKLLKSGITMVMVYCAIMIPLNFYGSYSIKGVRDVQNVLLFKKDKSIPVEYSFASAFFYIYYLLFSYVFLVKYGSKDSPKK